MKQNKTTETAKSVNDFIASLKDEGKRKDCYELVDMLRQLTKLEPKMWGASIVGFGAHHYRYESGREGDSPNFAFSPRASSIALYFSGDFENREALLDKLGKHKTDKGCVHIKTLSDVDQNVLKKMISHHIKHIAQLYPDKS